MMTDKGLLAQTEALVAQAGALLLTRFDRGGRPGDLADIGARIAANDALVMDLMREGLAAILPGSRLIEDELAEGHLGSGDAWIVDPVEGAINHIHGMDDWCVTATLMRDDRPYLTVVHLPLQGQTYTALAGQGAWLNGAPLRVSAKRDLGAAMVGTGQAAPGESAEVLARLAQSVGAMLGHALTVRVSVPATLQLIQVAAGRMEGFWQFSPVLSGLVSGALLVREAGGQVTDLTGADWGPEAQGLLAAPPQLTGPMVAVLSTKGN